MAKKPILELEELLGRFFLKEWIQDELRDIGESTSGSKSELIDRLLHSRWAQSKSVATLAEELLCELPLSGLKGVCQFFGIEIPRNKSQIVPNILKTVDVEPYVVHTKRICKVCGRNTQQELHFDDAWQAASFKCQICGTCMVIDAGESLGARSTQSIVPEVVREDAAILTPIEPVVESSIPPPSDKPPAVVNIVQVKVEGPEPKETAYRVPTSIRPSDVSRIQGDLDEIKESHGKSYVITLVLGLLAVGLTLFGVGATSSVRYWYLYEGAGIGVCLIAAAYFVLSLRRVGTARNP